MVKLGVNLDHVATLRQARGGRRPEPVRAALEAKRGGADGITLHLREDRRHIQDSDVWRIKRKSSLPLNLEMALHPEIIRIALRLRPEKVCVVPEKRREVTTEGGLDLISGKEKAGRAVSRLSRKGIEVSLFIDPDLAQVRMAKKLGAQTVELHTGAYANAGGRRKKTELKRLRQAAAEAHRLGLIVNAGHGLDYDNVKPVARIPHLNELNIGHSIVSRAVFTGLKAAVREMKRLIRG